MKNLMSHNQMAEWVHHEANLEFNQDDLISLRTKSGIHKLYPGITGWAQVNGRDNLTIEQKVKFESFYLKNQSFALDSKILIMTNFSNYYS